MTVYREGPELPEDVEHFDDSLRFPNGYRLWLPHEEHLRVALAAGWIVPVPDPPTFDEVLLKVNEGLAMSTWGGLPRYEWEVWHAGIAEARKRVERNG